MCFCLDIFGSSPAMTGRDWQEGKNVLLSGYIGKEVVTGITRSWRSLADLVDLSKASHGLLW